MSTSLPTTSLAGHRNPWGLTILATVVSTYALDAAATAAGIALASSGLLAGLDGPTLLLFLAASYLAWGVALRVNLAANWSLLTRTGTSSNVLSKAAHDLATAAGRGERARRAAASIGYIVTELAKEAPYYAGASGLVLVSDGIVADDALIFLAGANLGAAVYEYGLATATHALLRSRSPEDAYASFDVDWVPGEYLADYYTEVAADERETISYFVRALREAEPGRPMLVYGVGPTMHHVFAAARVASELHLTDYLPANLREIERWLANDPGAHDWRAFVEYTLVCEGVAVPTAAEIAEREALTRARVTRLLVADARTAAPVGSYSTVVSAYCADSATADRATWRSFMRNITGAVRPGGLFVTSALRRCRSYLVAGKEFPAANVDEDDVSAALDDAFGRSAGLVSVRHLPEHSAQGYRGIILASARAPMPEVSPTAA